MCAQLPGALWTLPALKKLFLGHNEFTGSLPEGVGHMQVIPQCHT